MNTGTPYDNKIWRLEHCYKIVDKQSIRRTMTLNIVQKKLAASPSLRKIVLKARQTGVSTYGLVDIYDDAVTLPNTTAAIIAHEQDGIEKLFRIPKRAYEFSAPELQPLIDRGGGSKYEMFFPKLNSRIYCDLEIRGDTIHKLHVSEAAFMEDDRLKATLGAVPIDTGKVLIESTANGMSGIFYDYWHFNTDYEKFFFPWFIFPEYQIPTEKLEPELTTEEKSFIKRTKKHFGVEITKHQIAYRRFKQRELKGLFMQEYPENDEECFLASGTAAMDLVKVARLELDAKKPYYEDDHVRLYVPYNNARLYACGVDTAEGVGGDWSRAAMFDVTTREQVATLNHHRTKPGEFGEALIDFCERFTSPGRPHPLLGIERNNHGHTVLLVCEQQGYPNLYYRIKGTDERGYPTRDERPGWVTDKTTRPVLLDTFIESVEDETTTLNDRETFKECRTLVNNEGKIEAVGGKHDDTIIAGAIGLRMVVESEINNSGMIRV